MFFVFAAIVAVTSAAQQIETITASSGASISTQLRNWGQVVFETILELAKQGLGICKEETSE